METSSPRLWSRFAGLFYVLSVASAVLAEFVFPHKLGTMALIAPLACYFLAVVFLFLVFRAVDATLALLAACAQIASLALEGLQWQPGGVNVAMVFHGIFCLLLGDLIARSSFIPRILGIPIALASLIWLLYLSPSLANRLAPYNTAVGLLAEALPMLWLLIAGTNAKRWHEQAGLPTQV